MLSFQPLFFSPLAVSFAEFALLFSEHLMPCVYHSASNKMTEKKKYFLQLTVECPPQKIAQEAKGPQHSPVQK